MPHQALFNVGFMLVLVGFAVIFLAFILSTITAAKSGGKIRGGGVVMIGPFPIFFSTDKESFRVLLILSTAIIAVFLILRFAVNR